MIYLIWMAVIVALYALTAWIEGVLTYRVSYLMDVLIEYAEKEDLCSIT